MAEWSKEQNFCGFGNRKLSLFFFCDTGKPLSGEGTFRNFISLPCDFESYLKLRHLYLIYVSECKTDKLMLERGPKAGLLHLTLIEI